MVHFCGQAARKASFAVNTSFGVETEKSIYFEFFPLLLLSKLFTFLSFYFWIMSEKNDMVMFEIDWNSVCSSALTLSQ